MTALSTIAFQNAELLIALDVHEPYENVQALANLLGRDRSNTKRSLDSLEAAGLVERLLTSPVPVLTPQGRAERFAAERALTGGGVLHALIDPDPENPRKDFTSDEARDALDELRNSIVEKDLLQPIVLRPNPDAEGRFLIVAGERRWRAIGEAITDDDWPADRPVPAEVRNITAAQARAMAIIENVQRRSLNRVEEGRAFKAMRDLDGLTSKEIADTIGKSEKHVTDHIKLIDELSEDDLARMVLPKDHPEHLKYRDARLKWRGHEEGSQPAPRAETPPPAQSGDMFPPEAGHLRAEPDDNGDDEIPDFLRKLAGPGDQAESTAPAQVAPPPAAAANAEPAAPAASRTPLLDTLTPAQHLIAVEVAHKVVTEPAAEGYRRTEVSPDAGGDDVDILCRLQALQLTHVNGSDGRSYMSIGYTLSEELGRVWPGLFDPDRAGTAMEKAQTELAWEQVKTGANMTAYLTPWLNGPFALSAEGEAHLTAKAERDAAEAAERQAKDEAKRAEAEADTDWLNRLITLADGARTFDQVTALIGERHPLPWSIRIEHQPPREAEGMIIDANGAPLAGTGDGLTAIRFLYAAAVHAYAGQVAPAFIPLGSPSDGPAVLEHDDGKGEGE